jgi:hypothetical protein
MSRLWLKLNMPRLLRRVALFYQKVKYPILGAYISLIVAEIGLCQNKIERPTVKMCWLHFRPKFNFILFHMKITQYICERNDAAETIGENWPCRDIALNEF